MVASSKELDKNRRDFEVDVRMAQNDNTVETSSSSFPSNRLKVTLERYTWMKIH